jgi:pilus assembly protein Flp/PilA
MSCGGRVWSGSKIVIKSLKSFVANESGATAIEYGLISALIAVFLIGALSALGTNMSSEFAEIGAALK